MTLNDFIDMCMFGNMIAVFDCNNCDCMEVMDFMVQGCSIKEVCEKCEPEFCVSIMHSTHMCNYYLKDEFSTAKVKNFFILNNDILVFIKKK